MENPICGHSVRGGGECKLDPGHRGYHSYAAYTCEGCGKRRRGMPHEIQPDGAPWENSFMRFCFLCSSQQVLRPPK